MIVPNTRPQIATLGELERSGYRPVSVKEEVRRNLVRSIKNKDPRFLSVIGYEDTVIPDLERALLSRHNVLLLGLRGQAKTRLARGLTHLLDEWIPVVEGSEINDDPFAPISLYARELIASRGPDTPISWLHRSERYGEKLATPDVSVADLIGDVDPIKAANQKLSFSDEHVLHYGIIPRSHRGIFVINELPDLQARIQVSLFNILQEGDIQIRGFKLRMPLDILFVFTANPEDYTNRGSIVTPLKDRIESQIITHYPRSVAHSRTITVQEANLLDEQRERTVIPELCELLIEQVAVEARKSEYVDQKSGVSARLTISAYENLVSAVERRALYAGAEGMVYARISDFTGILPAITGKIELVYEGEMEGATNIAYRLLGQAMRSLFTDYFPDPATFKKVGTGKPSAAQKQKANPYQPVIDWFGRGNDLQILVDDDEDTYRQKLTEVEGLYGIISQFHPKETEENMYLLMEFVLHGLAEMSLISKQAVGTGGVSFGDILGSMMNLDFNSLHDESED